MKVGASEVTPDSILGTHSSKGPGLVIGEIKGQSKLLLSSQSKPSALKSQNGRPVSSSSTRTLPSPNDLARLLKEERIAIVLALLDSGR
jgi:hypothetical protein